MNRNRKFKQLYGRLDMVDLDRHEKYYGSLGLADPFTIETKQGNPLLLDGTKERPFEGMRIFGKSTQDGTPSPDNPVPIVSAGDSGEIEAKAYGGNLISSDISSWNSNGWDVPSNTVFQLSDGIKIKAISGWRKVYYDTSEMNGKTLNLSFDYRQIESETTSPSAVKAFAIFVQNENIYPDPANSLFQIESPETVKTHVSVSFIARNYLCFFLRVNTEGEEAGETRTIEVTNIMLNAGNTELTYEPYKTPQSIVLSTPNGLPGIPVTSGGNYTDADGQQWVCDEVDFARGVYVQRVGKINVNLVYAYDSNEGYGYIVNPDNLLNTGLRVPILSNYFQFNKNIKNDGVGFAHSNGIRLYYTLGSVEAFNEWLSQNDVVVYYPFATPIETPLSSEQISAYKALHTYSPTTTVSNDADTEMEIKYKKYPIGETI